MDEEVDKIGNARPVAPLDVEGVHCPLCGYDLRGLTEPRCPECGYQFVWAELLDQKLKTHPYLFEHYPKRNVWSFDRTVRGGLNPVKFWRTLRPQMTPVPGRLLLYWLLCTMMPAVIGILLLGASDLADHYFPQPASLGWGFRGPARPWPPLPPPRPAFVEAIDLVVHFAPALFITSLVILAWSIATHLSLLIFQQSMAKAKILPIHVSRCVRYSFDVGVWFALMWIAAVVYVGFAGNPGLSVPLALVTISLAITPMGRLWAAYRLYLNFDHAFWVVLSSQVIAFLALLTIVMIPQWLG